MSFGQYAANQIAAGNAVPHTTFYVQCHTGSTGASGLSNISTVVPGRVSGAFTETANVLTNDAQIDLDSSGPGTNTLRTFSLWDAASGGNCIYTDGYFTPEVAVSSGDSVSFAAGAMVITLVVG